MLQLQPALLKRAAEIVGGEARLCQILEVSDDDLKLWAEATTQLPDPIFLRIVDLVLRDDIARASSDRRQAQRFNPRRQPA